MVRLTFICALLLFSAFSCSKEDEETIDPLENYPAYITSVTAPETATVGTTVPIKINFSVNNSCGEFKKFEVDEQEDATHIQVYPKYKPDQVCLMYIPIREVTYEFKPTEPGTYVFRFSPVYPEETITKTIVVGHSN